MNVLTSSRFRIESSIWNSQWFIEATNEERIAFIWSWTNNYVTYSGVYNPHFKETSELLGFDLRTALNAAVKARRIFVFDEYSLIWVTKFIKHQGFSGQLLVNAIYSLFYQTGDRKIIYPWLAVNHKTIMSNPVALQALNRFRWNVTPTHVVRLDDCGGIEERRLLKECNPDTIQSKIDTYDDISYYEEYNVNNIFQAVVPTKIQLAKRLESDFSTALLPKSSSDVVWGSNITREQAEMLFDYWKDTFGKSGRQKFIGRRVSALAARAREGLTFVEAKLAILGCYIDGKKRWPARLENPKAHDFELIFRNHSNVQNFIEIANEQLRSIGKKVSEDGSKLVDINE